MPGTILFLYNDILNPYRNLLGNGENAQKEQQLQEST